MQQEALLNKLNQLADKLDNLIAQQTRTQQLLEQHLTAFDKFSKESMKMHELGLAKLDLFLVNYQALAEVRKQKVTKKVNARTKVQISKAKKDLSKKNAATFDDL